MAKTKTNKSPRGSIKRFLQDDDTHCDGQPPVKAQHVSTGCSKADTDGKACEDAKEPRVKAKGKGVSKGKGGKNSNKAKGCGEDDVCNGQDSVPEPEHPEIGFTNEALQTPKVFDTVTTIDPVPEPEHPEIGLTNHVTEDTAGSDQGQNANEIESDAGHAFSSSLRNQPCLCVSPLS